MGMFDSLYIELDGRELELQTKRFENGLWSYRVGDWVAGCLPGVCVYFYPLWLDDDGKQIYGAERDGARKKTAFVVLVQGVFVDYQVHEGELAAETIEPILGQLRERWSDSARVRDFLVETLRAQQQRVAALESRLNRIRSIVANTRRLKAGEILGNRFGLLPEEDKKLLAGEEPFEVIAWALGDDVEEGSLCGYGTPLNPLDQYRL
jgi:hypothetical protein